MKIFMLHDVREFDPNFFPERYKLNSFLTDLEFIRGINKISNNICDPHHIFARLNNKIYCNDILLTFDDGLKDHLWVAEYLADRGIYAIFFIPFGSILEGKFIDSHLIQFLIASGYRNEIEKYLYSYLIKNNFSKKIIDNYRLSNHKSNTWSEQEIFITRVIREVFNFSTRKILLDYLVDKYIPLNLAQLHKSFYLNLSDINKILSLGHVLGSHGYFSYSLKNESESSIKSELSNSFDQLHKYPAIPYKSISWANGGFTDTIGKHAIGYGYEIGFGTGHLAVSTSSNMLNLPRLDATKLEIFV